MPLSLTDTMTYEPGASPKLYVDHRDVRLCLGDDRDRLLASSRLAHYAGGAIQVQDVLRTIPSDLVVFDRPPRGHRDPWLDVEPAYRRGEL